MTLTIARPRRSISPVFDEMDRMLGRIWRDGFSGGDDSKNWYPPVDIVEHKDAIVVKAEVPGLEKDNFKVAVEDGVLTISGEKKVEHEEKDSENNYHRMERTYGCFNRSFSLPSGVDAKNVRAKYRNGVLEVTLPKSDESKPREIEVDLG